MPIITRLRRRRFLRPAIWPYVRNEDSWQSKGLIGWYPLVGPLGYGYDFSGNGRHLNNVSGVDWRSDPRFGNIPLFDGSGGMNGNGEHFHLPAAPRTMMLWVRPAAINDSAMVIDVGRSGEVFRMQQHSSGGRMNHVTITPGFVQVQVRNAVAVDTWSHHVTVERSDSNRDLFLNGVQDSNNTGTAGGEIDESDSEVNLGQDVSANANYSGFIYDARLYNWALSDEQVAEIYLNGQELFHETGSPVYVVFSAPAAGGVAATAGIVDYEYEALGATVASPAVAVTAGVVDFDLVVLDATAAVTAVTATAGIVDCEYEVLGATVASPAVAVTAGVVDFDLVVLDPAVSIGVDALAELADFEYVTLDATPAVTKETATAGIVDYEYVLLDPAVAIGAGALAELALFEFQALAPTVMIDAETATAGLTLFEYLALDASAVLGAPIAVTAGIAELEFEVLDVSIPVGIAVTSGIAAIDYVVLDATPITFQTDVQLVFTFNEEGSRTFTFDSQGNRTYTFQD